MHVIHWSLMCQLDLLYMKAPAEATTKERKFAIADSEIQNTKGKYNVIISKVY